MRTLNVKATQEGFKAWATQVERLAEWAAIRETQRKETARLRKLAIRNK